MQNDRLLSQVTFILEVDKMKNVLRQTLITDGSRRENDAEHSWHLALCAMVFMEYGPKGLDMEKVLKMCIVHDLVEIYAGDTFAYDVKGNEDKALREEQAADKLFALLPKEQGAEIRALWERYDAMEDKEACYANAMDRLQPLLHNWATQGHTWRAGNVKKAQVLKRMDMVRQATPEIWPFVLSIIEGGIEKGYIKED